MATAALLRRCDRVVELSQQRAQLAHLARADPFRPFRFEFLDELPGDLIDISATSGGPDQLRAPVVGIGYTLHVAIALEVCDKGGHGLFGDLRSLGKHADTGSRFIQELQDVPVGCADAGVPALRKALMQKLGADPEGLTKQVAEIVGTPGFAELRKAAT